MSTSASKSSAGYTALTRPHPYASAAEIRSASRAIRIARMRPTAAAISAEAPPSGISPILVNASMKNAFSEASTTSQASASETPDTGGRAVHARPRRAAGRAAIARMQRLAASSTSAGVPDAPGLAWSSSLMPAPEQKPRPAPPMRTTRTRGSFAARSSVEANVCSIGAVSELRLSGRFRVTVRTPSVEADGEVVDALVGVGARVGRGHVRPLDLGLPDS